MPPPEYLGKHTAPDDVRRLGAQIAAARARQRERYAELADVHCNAQAGSTARRTIMRPRAEALQLLKRAVARYDLSVRAYEKTLTVARSIADLDAASDVDAHHVAEALQYRLQPA